MMDFNRAVGVRVNGKEVNRVAFNGITVWEKKPSSILLTSDVSVASVGDTVNLTATVLDNHSQVMSGQSVDFYSLGSVVESGTSITCTSGSVTTLDSNSIQEGDEITIIVSSISGTPALWFYYGSGYRIVDLDGVSSGSTIKIVQDSGNLYFYVDDNLEFMWSDGKTYSEIMISLDSEETCTVDSYTHTGDRIIGSGVSDSNGQCSVSYNVKDTNPLNIKAKSDNIQSEIHIPIWIVDDIASQSGLSLFDSIKRYSGSRNSTLSYDSSKEAYKIVTGSGYGFAMFPITALTNIGDFHLEMDILTPGSYTYVALAQDYWGTDSIDSTSTGKQTHYSGISRYKAWVEGRGTNVSYYKLESGSVSTNTWYHLIIEFKDGVRTYKLYDYSQTTLIFEDSRTLDYDDDSTQYVGLNCGYDGNTTKYYKNIKARTL